MSDGDHADAVHYLAAIRMALEAAANDETALAVIDEILKMGPKCGPRDLWPTRILVDAIQMRQVGIQVPA